MVSQTYKSYDTAAERWPSRLLEAQEVADYLRVPSATLHSWRRRGRGPRAMRIGKYLRYDPADLQTWLDEQRAS